MMGPALFELYSTGLSPRQGSSGLSAAKNANVQATEEPDQNNKKPLIKESSFKAATSFFSRKGSVNASSQQQQQPTQSALSPGARGGGHLGKAMSLDTKAAGHLREQFHLPQPLRSYRVKYIGQTVLDRRYTLPMLPWIITDIKQQGCETTASGPPKNKDIFLQVTDVALKATTVSESRLLFVHPLHTINKFTQTSQDKSCFTYLTRDTPDSQFTCHVFQASDESVVLELFTTIRDSTKEIIPSSSGSSGQLVRMGSYSALDSIMSNSQQYEVMFVGRLRVSQKRAPPSFIDDAVDKFKEEREVRVKELAAEAAASERTGSNSSINSLTALDPLMDQEFSCSMHRPRSITSLTTCDERNEDATSPTLPDVPTIEIALGNVLGGDSPSMSAATKESIMSDLHNLETASSGFDFPKPKSPNSPNSLGPPSSSLITNSQSLDSEARVSIIRDLGDVRREIRDTDIVDSRNVLIPGLSPALSPETRARSVSGDIPPPPRRAGQAPTSRQVSLPLSSPRPRTNSGAATAAAGGGGRNKHSNKPMLFLIGRLELCLISPDRHQVLLNKTFNYVSHCSQGIKYADHFGFVCTSAEGYVGFVFRCQAERLVEEIMHALKQAFSNAHHAYQSNKTHKTTKICATCPMSWFHQLCCDVEGQNSEKTWLIVSKAVETGLNDDEQIEVMSICDGAKVPTIREKNAMFMMKLRELCERKQEVHVHVGGAKDGITPAKKDKEQVYVKERSSSIDTFRRSLSSSVEAILKKPSPKAILTRDSELGYRGRLRSSTESLGSGSTLSPRSPKPYMAHGDHSPESHTTPEVSPGATAGAGGSSSGSKADLQFTFEEKSARPRSSTLPGLFLAEAAQETPGSRQKSPIRTTLQPVAQKTNIFSMFMKIGNQSKVPTVKEESPGSESPEPIGAVRRNILNRVQPQTVLEKKVVSFEEVPEPKRRTSSELRQLWRKAYKQQLLLIQMEKENKRMKDAESGMCYKRMKLDYPEVHPCSTEALIAWDRTLQNKWHYIKPASDEIGDNVKLGVPRHKRGEIWMVLAEKHRLEGLPEENRIDDVGIDPEEDYRELLQQLTSQQHAILVDLGRTFPKHPFYAQPLGPGQLSLYNMLKAYSLLDHEVGYCQGLSFVAGILLLHMTEDEAFEMMKHLLFHFGLRKQYKPDMSALQLQLYQLTRLVFDFEADLYAHFERNDISATLYAAPWFLTLFASQFPIGFVSRIFDIIFWLGLEGIFRVSLALLQQNKDALMACRSFESIMDFLRADLPKIKLPEMEEVFERVFAYDLKKKLTVYEIEYNVVQEELLYRALQAASTKSSGKESKSKRKVSTSQSTQATSTSEYKEKEAQTSNSPTRGASPTSAQLILDLQTTNRTLNQENMELNDQLHVAHSNVSSLESSLDGYKSTIKRLELRVRTLEDERDALLHSVNTLRRRCDNLEAAASRVQEERLRASEEEEQRLATLATAAGVPQEATSGATLESKPPGHRAVVVNIIGSGGCEPEDMSSGADDETLKGRGRDKNKSSEEADLASGLVEDEDYELDPGRTLSNASATSLSDFGNSL